MNIRNRNISFGRTKLLIATALTLLFSVAQSDETRFPPNGLEDINLPDKGFGLGYSRGFIDMNAPAFPGDSNASVAVSNADGFGEISLVEMHTNESTRRHFNFQSNVTNDVLSATLLTSGDAYSLTFDLPSGQILVENDIISVITPTGFSQLHLSGNRAPDIEDGHFSAMLNGVLRRSDMLGFNMSMAESIAESDLLSLALAEEEYSKGGDHHTDGIWACAGALTILAAANAALAASIAATYATAGAATMAISATVSAVGAAMAVVDRYCLQL